MQPRIIVCALGRTGYKIYNLLKQQSAHVVGISDRPIPGDFEKEIIIGDARTAQTLIAAGVREADTLVLAGNNDALNLAILTQAKVINPRIRIVNRLFNATLGERLDRTLADHVTMSVSALAAPIFAFAALGNKAIGHLNLYKQTWPIQEEIIHDRHPWRGMKLSELWENPSRMLIYYLPANGEYDLISAVVAGKSLQTGDHLIIGTQPQMKNLKRSVFSKFWKLITSLGQFNRYGRSVALMTLTLLVTILFTSLTYVVVNYNISPVDALYFSVGMITGAGGQEQVAEKSSDGMKIFTAIMMLVGAGLVGICYALINDFVLGSRMKQFWDVARVPTRNHYIVCGLGQIGMRIVNHLLSQGHEVVVIDSDPNNRFLYNTRSLGVPVILEDANLSSTLRAANIKNAAALIAVTSDDMVNVEIALCAKAVQPKIPIVVRNHDPQSAQSVQQVFEFENVLCPTELATPAFVAAALGGKILGNGMTDDLLWVALATLITPNHPFCDKTVIEAAKDADFVPLYIESLGQQLHGWTLLEICLQPGDVLYLTMPAMKLNQLWRGVEDLELLVN